MKLQLLAESGLDQQQSTSKSELAKKEMVVLELNKEIEVNALITAYVYVCLYSVYNDILWKPVNYI